MNLYKVLPDIGKIKKWIKEKEEEAKNEFGFTLNIDFRETNNQLLIDAVCKLVSDVLTVPVNKILSASRETAEKEARHIVMFLCKKHIEKIHPKELAAYFDKERTTVLHAFDRIEDLLSVSDASITEKLKSCEDELLKRINA